MIVLLIRYLLVFYFIGLIILLLFKAGGLIKKETGILAVILFPLMLLTKKGRENLQKGIK